MFSRIICLTGMQPSLFAESEYKGKANFRTAKIFQGYFSWKIKLFSTGFDFQRVIKWKKFKKKRGKGESLCQASESQVYLSFYSERSQGSSPWSGIKGVKMKDERWKMKDESGKRSFDSLCSNGSRVVQLQVAPRGLRLAKVVKAKLRQHRQQLVAGSVARSRPAGCD